MNNGVTTMYFTRDLAYHLCFPILPQISSGNHPLTADGRNAVLGAYGDSDTLEKHLTRSAELVSS